MCCTRLAENTGRKHDAKNAICAPWHKFVTKACIDNRKMLLSINISSICLHNLVNTAHQRLRAVREFGAPQQISTGFASCQRYCTDVAQRKSTKLCTMFGCLLRWYIIYTFLGAITPLRNFARCKIHFASKSCVLPYLFAALLHGTRAVGVSQTLRRSAEGATYIRQGSHHVGHRPTFYFTIE